MDKKKLGLLRWVFLNLTKAAFMWTKITEKKNYENYYYSLK